MDLSHDDDEHKMNRLSTFNALQGACDNPAADDEFYFRWNTESYFHVYTKFTARQQAAFLYPDIFVN